MSQVHKEMEQMLRGLIIGAERASVSPLPHQPEAQTLRYRLRPGSFWTRIKLAFRIVFLGEAVIQIQIKERSS